MTVVEVPRLRLPMDAYIALSVVLATLWLYPIFSIPSRYPMTSLKDRVLSVLLLWHTLYMLHALLVSPPQNIFRSLGLPLNTPSEYMFARLAETYGGERNVPAYLAVLPRRLGLMELRSLYVRFGHEVIAGCFYCQSSDDYAFYAFPTPLVEYIREMALIGILTLPRSPTSYLRPLGLGALLAAALTETYWTLTVQITVPPFGNDTPVTMWHDTLMQLRHSLFLVLPLLVSVFPHLALYRVPVIGAFFPPPPRSPLQPPQFKIQGQSLSLPANVTFNQMSTITLQALGHLLPTLHLLKYVHGAIMRSQNEISSSTAYIGNADEGTSSGSATPPQSIIPSPHALATQWWADEAREGHIIRTSKDVCALLKEEGLTSGQDISGLPEGQLLLSAKMAVKMLKEQGAGPSEHWMYADDTG